MLVTAKLNYLRMAPRKVRLVADLIRGKSVEQAQIILNFSIKRVAHPLLKLLKSAMANAKNNFKLEESNLYISKITVDEGPKYKRWMPRARGQAYEIQKKTSHITLILDTIKKETKKIKKAKKISRSAMAEAEKTAQLEKVEKEEKPKAEIKRRPERKKFKPSLGKGIKRIFRRKSF